MKNTDLITRRIIAAGFTFCAILFFASIFLFTVSNVMQSHAAPAPPVTLTGDIMMVPYMTKDSEVILVWNTTTGKSVSWFFDELTKKYQKSPEMFQLPINPLN